MPERIEHGVLLALAFVLPLLEAPKNLLWAAFVAIWIVNRVRARDFGGRWEAWDTLIALWIASGFVVALFAGIQGDEWRAAIDIVRYASVLWALRRSRYPDETWIALLGAIVAGTVVALAWGYYGVLVESNHKFLGLHSVGHVNHSAIYLTIVFGAALAAGRAWWRAIGRAGRAAALALIVFLVISLVWMQSRGAVGAALAVAIALLGTYAWRQGRGLRRVVIGAALAVGVTILLKPQVVEKYEARMEEDQVLAFRDQIWRIGLMAWREYPFFGVGMDNFGLIGRDRVMRWAKERGEPIDETHLFFTSHAHSLYVNTLAERGLVGVAVLLAVLAAWGIALVRGIPEANAPPLAWTCWGGATSAWLTAVIVGAVNTTLHHEHALLSMLLLGAWQSIARNRVAAGGR